MNTAQAIEDLTALHTEAIRKRDHYASEHERAAASGFPHLAGLHGASVAEFAREALAYDIAIGYLRLIQETQAAA